MLFCQPERCDTGPAAEPAGWGRWGCWGGGVVGDNLSQVTLMEDGKVLHSACEWAAAGPDDGNNSPQQQHIAHNSLSRTAARAECAEYQSISNQGVTAAAHVSSSSGWLEAATSCLSSETGKMAVLYVLF